MEVLEFAVGENDLGYSWTTAILLRVVFWVGICSLLSGQSPIKVARSAVGAAQRLFAMAASRFGATTKPDNARHVDDDPLRDPQLDPQPDHADTGLSFQLQAEINRYRGACPFADLPAIVEYILEGTSLHDAAVDQQQQLKVGTAKTTATVEVAK